MTMLDIAEIQFESGEVRFRYSRKMSADGSRWVREGLFQAFHENGTLASEGHYVDGVENGLWQDFHDNGQMAAQGTYISGVEAEDWRYWSADGAEDYSANGR